MQFLVLIVFVLFAGVEFFQWLRGVVLPLPVYVLAGAFLAIASNYGKGLGVLFEQRTGQPVQMAVTVEAPTLELTEKQNSSLLLEEQSQD